MRRICQIGRMEQPPHHNRHTLSRRTRRTTITTTTIIPLNVGSAPSSFRDTLWCAWRVGPNYNTTHHAPHVLIVAVVSTVKTNNRPGAIVMTKAKNPMLQIRADVPWLMAVDDIACKLKLGNRSRCVEIAMECLATMTDVENPSRVQHPEEPPTDRFTHTDKARLLSMIVR